MLDGPVSLSLIEPVRVFTQDVAAHADDVVAPAARPALTSRDELRSEAGPPVAVGNDQPADLGRRLTLNPLASEHVDPADDGAVHFRDESPHVVAIQDRLEPSRNLYRRRRVAELTG